MTDLSRRICTAADIKFYFNSLYGGNDENEESINTKKNYLKANKNCNLTTWLSGCEPGWACSVSKDVKLNMRDTKVIYLRNLDCRPCCAGFFCPRGLTCMIRKYLIPLFPSSSEVPLQDGPKTKSDECCSAK